MYTNFNDLYEKTVTDNKPLPQIHAIFIKHLNALEKEYPKETFLSPTDQKILENIKLYGHLKQNDCFIHAAKIFLVERARSLSCMSDLLRYQNLLKEKEIKSNLETIYNALKNQKHLPLSEKDEAMYETGRHCSEKSLTILPHFRGLYNEYLKSIAE